jgi:hypothetical protein
LQINDEIRIELNAAINSNTINQRETHLVNAQVLLARLHNESQLTDKFEINIQSYFGRDIKVIFADRIADMIKNAISDDELKKYPLIGSLSQIGNFVALSDEPKYISNIKKLYKSIIL